MDARKRPTPGGPPPPAKRVFNEDGAPTENEMLEMLYEEDEAGYMPEDIDEVAAEEAVILENIAERGERWKRPDLPPFDPKEKDIVFQQLEIDYIIGKPDAEYLPSFPSRAQAPILRVFGVTEEGNSVCAFVHGFLPYFYIAMPRGFQPDHCESFRNSLNAAVKASSRRADKEPLYVLSVSISEKESLMYYQRSKAKLFLKITLALPTMVPTARGILERGFAIPGLDIGTQSFTTYESNVLFTLRFMVDRDIGGGMWLEACAGSYRVRAASDKLTDCCLEIDLQFADLISHKPEGRFARLAPFRVLSFDIECAGRKGHFPEAQHDSVIQIANLVTLQGQSKPIIRNVLCLRGCSPIVGTDVLCYDDERQLLKAWRDLINVADPDILIGYNIVNFDMPYLIDRAKALGVEGFELLGRVKHSKVRVRDTTFSSKAYGTRESKEITIEGRVQFDLLQAIQRDHKLSSYSLNAVSAHFLGEQKEDVHHSIISDLFNGNDSTRHRLAVYCLKDAYLPQRLLDKLMFMYNYIEMARVTGVPLSFLLARGQSIKILRKAKQRNLLVPNMKGEGGQETYEGATVLEPKARFYEDPIATLDFASLYPSIMMAHNLCYCTLVPSNEVQFLSADQMTKTPSGEYFVKSNVTKGILPEILEELLSARKRAKADLKNATDPFERAVLDGRQLALKISANSVYGFTGATIGQLPCLEISSSVTAFGRDMIHHTRNLVESTYTKANGYEADAEVIYGDTDSVMINFGLKDITACMELGRKASEFISGTFPKPIKLEFEKVYYPYLLISKKRYAGLYWTRPDKFDKMDTKGIETVRRDNCLLVKNVVTTCLEKILMQRDVAGAVEYVKNTIQDLLMNRLDLSLLVITKGLSKDIADYDAKSAHTSLAEKLKKRDAATAPSVGDRVAYVIVKGDKNAKAYERSEDPMYVLENSIPIDYHHYLEHQLAQPLLRIFEPILKDAESVLLKGDHTRSVFISTPTVGGIMKFAKKRVQCLGCKALITDSDSSLCKHCRDNQGDLYQQQLAKVNELEDQFGRLWTQCQRCQGSLHQDVLCTSRDCPIFYRRRKVQRDLELSQETLLRYDW
eukprot:jgi/Mesvir1/14962/Mv14630-RA.2